jgi:hypothetical protein
MRWSSSSLLEVEADLRRDALERAARAWHPGAPMVARARPGHPWRIALGRRPIRLGRHRWIVARTTVRP